MRRAAVVSADRADAPHVVTLINGKYEEALTSRDFNYTALRSVTMIIRIKIEVLGEATPSSPLTALCESRTKGAMKSRMSCVFTIIHRYNRSM
jgi:hypothetical protein